jgi:hypothetical protein
VFCDERLEQDLREQNSNSVSLFGDFLEKDADWALLSQLLKIKAHFPNEKRDDAIYLFHNLLNSLGCIIFHETEKCAAAIGF